MTSEPDPYRVLGLARGASADDIRRAYRRLVKANHPDSAGPAALPRFLAIQAAYEALENGAATRRTGGRPRSAASTPERSRQPGRPPAGARPRPDAAKGTGAPT